MELDQNNSAINLPIVDKAVSSQDSEEQIENSQIPRKTIKLGHAVDHLKIYKNSLKYTVPELCRFNIVFIKREADLVKQALVYGDIFPDNYDNTIQKWIYEDSNMNNDNDQGGFRLFYEDYSPTSKI